MKRYSFRLATVLRVRRAEEVRDRDHLVAMNSRFRDLIEVRDKEALRYESLVMNLGSATLATFSASQLESELAACSLAEANRRVAKGAGDAAVAQVAWLAASRNVAIIERLDERRRIEHLEAARKADADVIDDLVTTRFVLDQLANKIDIEVAP